MCKNPPYHGIIWAPFCSELCCSLSAAQCCKDFQHKYFGFTLDALTLSEDFAVMNPIICIMLPCSSFFPDMHPLVMHQEKVIYYISSGTFAPIRLKESLKNKNKINCTSVGKWTLNQYSLLIQMSIFDSYLFSHLYLILLLLLCKTMKFASKTDDIQSCSDSALSVCRRILPGDRSCRTQQMIHRVSDCLESAQHLQRTLTLSPSLLMLTRLLTHQCTQFMSAHKDLRLALYFLAVN